MSCTNTNIPQCGENECISLTKYIDASDANVSLKFAIVKQLTDTVSSGSDVTTEASVTEQLVLCDNTVEIKNLCCLKNSNSLIIGLPLQFTKKNCYVYNIVPPEISPSTTDYSSNITVLVGNNVKPVDLQLSKGYLYIIIKIDPVKDIVLKNDLCSITLKFSNFKLDLTKTFKACSNDKCKQITYQYGIINPIF